MQRNRLLVSPNNWDRSNFQQLYKVRTTYTFLCISTAMHYMANPSVEAF